MNLLTAHKLMVTTAILFCTGFAVRELVLGELLLGAASGGGAVGLAIYLRWLLRSKGKQLRAAARREPRDN